MTLRSLFIAFLVLVMGQVVFAATPLTDDAIFDQVRIKLANDPDVRGGAIDVTVKEGNVELKGNVKSPKAKAKAERLAKKVKGVKTVKNNLKVSAT